MVVTNFQCIYIYVHDHTNLPKKFAHKTDSPFAHKTTGAQGGDREVLMLGCVKTNARGTQVKWTDFPCWLSDVFPAKKITQQFQIKDKKSIGKIIQSSS